MKDSNTERWELILAVVLLLLIAMGIYVARREAPLFSITSPRETAVSAKHKPKSTSRPESSAQKAREPRASTERDAAVEGLEDCRGKKPYDTEAAQTRPLLLSELQAIAVLVDSDRSTAMERLRVLANQPVTDAYLAYLLLDAGKTEEAKPVLARAHHGLAEPACVLTLQDLRGPKRNPLALALRTLRMALESVNAPVNSIPLACSVFQTHPKEAVWAFAGVWGNAADRAGGAMKRYCVVQLLRRASPQLVREVTQAQETLGEALLLAHALPESQAYESIYVIVNNIIRDAVLAPELVTLVDEAAATRELNQMATDDLALGERIATYRKVAGIQATPIGKGLCAVLAVRDKPTDANACEHLARKSAHEALHFWLSAIKGGRQ